MTNDELIAQAHQEFDQIMRGIGLELRLTPKDDIAGQRRLQERCSAAIEALKAVYLDTDWFDDD